MTTIFKKLFKLAALVVLVAILIPVLYITWRASRPMSLPEFNGLSYFQYVEWRQMAYAEALVRYRIAHPNEEIKNPESCIQSDLFVENGPGWFIAAGIVRNEWNATWFNYLPELWAVREKLILGAISSGSARCVITDIPIPTPEQFDALKMEWESAQIPKAH